MLVLTIVVATLLPIVSYLIVGLSRKSKAITPEEYFVYGQSISASDYANTSVGYALQMAAIFLFAYWGVLYGLGGLWVCLFWMLGFLLLYSLIPRFWEFHQQKTTFHGYLGAVFGSRRLQFWAAICSVIGLWGTMMAEIDYATIVYSPALEGLPRASTWLLQAFFLVFGAGYIIFNGYKAEVNTERFQVPCAYGALLAVLLYTLPNVHHNSGSSFFLIISSLFAFSLILIIVGKLMTGGRSALGTLLPLAALVVLALVAFVTIARGETVPPASSSVMKGLAQSAGDQFKAQGIVALGALFLANVFWLPVDISTWQRIASVEGEAKNALVKSLRRGTLRVLLESPASWILGVVLGLIMVHGGYVTPGEEDSSLLTFSSRLLNADSGRITSYTALLFYALFIIACVSIMLSTVNSLISAIAYTAYRDLRPMEKTAGNGLLWPRVVTSLILVAGLVIYPVLTRYYGARLQMFLYAAYAAQLSLVFVGLAALFKVEVSPRAGVASVIGGLLGTVISFGLLVYYPQSLPSTDVLPPAFAIVGAFCGLVLFTGRPPVEGLFKK